MADIDVNGAIGAGFGLIRRRPLSVLAWGLVQTAGYALFFAAYVPLLLTFSSVAQQAAAGGSSPSPDEGMRIVRGMIGAMGFVFLAAIFLILIRSVVTGAIWRAVIRPDESAWASLRIGARELYLVLLSFAAGFAANLIMLPVLPVEFVVIALVAAHQYVVAAIVGVVAVIAIFVGVFYVLLRFSVLGPMIVDEGRFAFAEAWTLTRGQVGALFLIGLGLAFIVLVMEAVVALVFGGVAMMTLNAAAGGFEHLDTFFKQPPAAILTGLWPIAAAWIVGGVPIAGAFSAILLAPWAKAYVDLKYDPSEALA